MSDLLLDPSFVASEKAKVNPKKTQKVSDLIDSFGYTLNGRAQGRHVHPRTREHLNEIISLSDVRAGYRTLGGLIARFERVDTRSTLSDHRTFLATSANAWVSIMLSLGMALPIILKI